jgi:hypothetical protein
MNSTETIAALDPGYRKRPPMEGVRLFHGLILEVPEFAQEAYQTLQSSFEKPFVGLTTDGVPREGLVSPAADGTSTAQIAAAANEFLDRISRPDLRQRAVQAFDHQDRRRWFNAFPDWVPAGILLDDLTAPERDAAMAIVEAALGEHGAEEARKVMRLNGLLGDFVDTYVDSLREYTYFFTIFGQPDPDRPWAWQLMGHHLALNCLVLPTDVVLTPMFMGSEFNGVEGVTVFEEEAAQGLALIRALTPEQTAAAVLHSTMDPAKLPAELAGPVDGRHRGGAGRDNLVIGYEGVCAARLDTGQQEQLLDLIEVYLKRMPEPQRLQRRREVREHLDETYFAWIGDPAAGPPFYYRIHSPVLWIEFDHHQGIFLDNDLPEPYHVHTIVRTPNGGDYGANLGGFDDEARAG